MKISATTPADIYDEAFAKMHAILGNGDEPGRSAATYTTHATRPSLFSGIC